MWETHNFHHLIELYKMYSACMEQFARKYEKNTFEDFESFSEFVYFNSSKGVYNFNHEHLNRNEKKVYKDYRERTADF